MRYQNLWCGSGQNQEDIKYGFIPDQTAPNAGGCQVSKGEEGGGGFKGGASTYVLGGQLDRGKSNYP